MAAGLNFTSNSKSFRHPNTGLNKYGNSWHSCLQAFCNEPTGDSMVNCPTESFLGPSTSRMKCPMWMKCLSPALWNVSRTRLKCRSGNYSHCQGHLQAHPITSIVPLIKQNLIAYHFRYVMLTTCLLLKPCSFGRLYVVVMTITNCFNYWIVSAHAFG